jgi:hypothetical protein
MRRAWRKLGFRFAAPQPTALSSPSPGVPHPHARRNEENLRHSGLDPESRIVKPRREAPQATSPPPSRGRGGGEGDAASEFLTNASEFRIKSGMTRFLGFSLGVVSTAEGAEKSDTMENGTRSGQSGSRLPSPGDGVSAKRGRRGWRRRINHGEHGEHGERRQR